MEQTDTEEASAGAGRPWLRYGLAALVLAALVAAYQLLPVQAWAEAFRDWIQGLGTLGWVAFVAIYAVAVAALVPGALLTLAGGLAFGLWGFPLVLVGATLGAAMAFVAARHLLRERVERSIDAHPKFRAVDAAIEEDGWKVVGLLRLSPAVPFSLQNWILGATSVAFWPYLAATFVGIMPGTLLYVWLGSAGGRAASGGGSAASYALLAVGILATVAVTVVVGRRARAKLEEHGVED